MGVYVTKQEKAHFLLILLSYCKKHGLHERFDKIAAGIEVMEMKICSLICEQDNPLLIDAECYFCKDKIAAGSPNCLVQFVSRSEPWYSICKACYDKYDYLEAFW
jgi:hypothetical protein